MSQEAKNKFQKRLKREKKRRDKRRSMENSLNASRRERTKSLRTGRLQIFLVLSLALLGAGVILYNMGT